MDSAGRCLKGSKRSKKGEPPASFEVTPTARAQWLLRFCTGRERLSGIELKRVQHEWFAFFGTQVEGGQIGFEALRRKLGKIFNNLVDGTGFTFETTASRNFQMSSGKLECHTFFDDGAARGPLNVALTALEAVKDQFRLCHRCQQPFIKEGKRKYCSQRCGSSANKAAYRKRKQIIGLHAAR